MPIAALLAVVTAIGTYVIASGYTRPLATSAEQRLLQSTQAVVERTNALYITQRTEAQRIAFTDGLLAALQTGDTATLQTTLQTLAQTAQLDSVLLINMNGVEITGLLLVESEDAYGYSTGTPLGDQRTVQQLVVEGTEAAGLIDTTEGLLLYVGVPMVDNGVQVGAVLVGLRLDRVLAELKGSATADVILYDSGGRVLQTTMPLTEGGSAPLAHDTINETLVSVEPMRAALQINEMPYQVMYTPFVYGQSALGVSATVLADSVASIASRGRQVLALFLATLAGSIVLVVVALINRRIEQLERIQQAARAIADGRLDTRTRLDPADEVGAVGQALDEIARASQLREDRYTAALHHERQGRRHLVALMETISDGIVLFDAHHQLVLMNQTARGYLKEGNAYATLEQHTQRMMTHPRGQFLAPDLQRLGEPHQLTLNGRMFVVQVVEMTSQHPTGRAVILQAISQARDSAPAPQPAIARDAAALQQLITHMRDITTAWQTPLKPGSLSAEALMLAVANDWRQIAKSADIELRIAFRVRGRFVVGDERQLRQAIGNLVDNAIKYTPQSGAVALEVLEEIDGKLYVRVRDNGVGIAQDDLPHLYEPFYRGTPITTTGDVLRVPGLGDGLTQTQRIIRAHGGSMKVKSRLGVGTAVYFSLPLTQPRHAEALPTFDEDVMEGETVGLPEGPMWDQLDRL